MVSNLFVLLFKFFYLAKYRANLALSLKFFFISVVLLEGERSFLFLPRSPEVISLPLGNSSFCELSIEEYPDWPYGGSTFLHGDFITTCAWGWDWGRTPRCLSLHPLLGVWGEIIAPLPWSILNGATATLSNGDPIILGGYARGADDEFDPDYSSAVYQRATGEWVAGPSLPYNLTDSSIQHTLS